MHQPEKQRLLQVQPKKLVLVFSLQNKEKAIRKRQNKQHSQNYEQRKALNTYSIQKGLLIKQLKAGSVTKLWNSPSLLLDSQYLEWALVTYLCHQQGLNPKFSPQKTSDYEESIPAANSWIITLPAVYFFSSIQILTRPQGVFPSSCLLKTHVH